ncbi:MAG: hypothetical protein AAB967_03830 [Patescibacteria group bacterium]
MHDRVRIDCCNLFFREAFYKLCLKYADLFKQKIEQPAPAEGGGLPDTSAPTPTSENAKELAMERLKQLQAT